MAQPASSADQDKSHLLQQGSHVSPGESEKVHPGDPDHEPGRMPGERETVRSGWRGWPRQVYFIMGNEVCERFSFYGMRAILVVYMTGSLGMLTSNAESAFHVFTAACYLLPLAGAWLADHVLGKYPVILYLSIVYCCGHAVLAIFESRLGLLFGLALISLGTGGIKPCVSALVGDQIPEKDNDMLEGMFAAFYWCINLGSFFSMASIPLVLKISGSSLAFAIPGIFMGIALLIFLAGRNMYIIKDTHVGSGTQNKWGSVIWHCIKQAPDRRPGQGFWHPASSGRFSQLEIDTAQSLVSILGPFACMSMFQALFDQNSSTWVVQGTKMDLNIFGWEMPASQIQALNPVLVLTLIPLFESKVYPAMEQQLGRPLLPLQKMSVGMFLAATPFFYLAVFQYVMDRGGKPHILWQAPAHLLLTVSELLVNISGLQFSYSQAPASLKSTILSMSLCTLFVGNSLDAVIMKINYFNEFWSFVFFALLMFCTACIFLALAWNYNVKDFTMYNNASTESQGKEVSLEMATAALDSGQARLLSEASCV